MTVHSDASKMNEMEKRVKVFYKANDVPPIPVAVLFGVQVHYRSLLLIAISTSLSIAAVDGMYERPACDAVSRVGQDLRRFAHCCSPSTTNLDHFGCVRYFYSAAKYVRRAVL